MKTIFRGGMLFLLLAAVATVTGFAGTADVRTHFDEISVGSHVATGIFTWENGIYTKTEMFRDKVAYSPGETISFGLRLFEQATGDPVTDAVLSITICADHGKHAYYIGRPGETHTTSTSVWVGGNSSEDIIYFSVLDGDGTGLYTTTVDTTGWTPRSNLSTIADGTVGWWNSGVYHVYISKSDGTVVELKITIR